MKESFRWYGPSDPVTLSDIRQAGATDIVTALHEIPNGEVWPIATIMERKALIESNGLHWSVVESIPVHEAIKQGLEASTQYIENYKQSIRHLAQCGIYIICYNFMPVLDWTRTSLDRTLADGSKALAFELDALYAFDLFIAQRKKANQELLPEQIESAKHYYHTLDNEARTKLTQSIIAGLPGSEEGYDLNRFKTQIAVYENMTANALREHLIHFLGEVVPVAESCGSFLSIHPDDPPFSFFGIPRVVSTAADLQHIFDAVPSLHNGLTFCTGSLGVRSDNDLYSILETFAHRVHFLHLRSTRRDAKGNFYEADHLTGDVDMHTIVRAVLKEEQRRETAIPMRPDHGHQMLDDLHKTTNPGYSAIGRLRGLAELRGLALGIRKSEPGLH